MAVLIVDFLQYKLATLSVSPPCQYGDNSCNKCDNGDDKHDYGQDGILFINETLPTHPLSSCDLRLKIDVQENVQAKLCSTGRLSLQSKLKAAGSNHGPGVCNKVRQPDTKASVELTSDS